MSVREVVFVLATTGQKEWVKAVTYWKNKSTAMVDGNPHNRPFSFAEFLKQSR